MRNRTVSARIVAALQLRPMTVAELSPAVCSTHEHVRTCLSVLRASGRVRQGDAAPRSFRKGATPRFWEAA